MPEPLLAGDAYGIAETARLLSTGLTSSEELTRAALTRIERHNPALNAVISVDEDGALETARRADREIRAGRPLGPLHGIPIGIKDVIDVSGTRTSMGSMACRSGIASRDASAVHRLRRSGAVIIGKLNTQQFAYGATGEASLWGPTRNPHDLDRITGGSSGGPAAAVASGMCAGALGTDTGGSIRIPAALCGLVGLKPTTGRISSSGVAPLSWTLDHVGPITRSVTDNALLLGALSNSLDPRSAWRGREEREDDPVAGAAGLRLGVPEPYFAYLDPGVRAAVDSVLRTFENLGSRVQQVDIRGYDSIVHDQRTVVATEAYASLRRRYAASPEAFDPTVQQRLQDGSQVPAWRYAEALRSRGAATDAFDAALVGVDILVAPTVPITAPAIGEQETLAAGLHEPVQSALTRLCGPTNFTGHPSLTVPCGSSGGLPVGVQFIGRWWDEVTLYRAARAFEEMMRNS